MAKRSAGEQLTREELASRGSDSEGEEQPSGIALASKDVMSRRKIAMPKRKMAFPTTMRSNNDESKVANAFSFAKQTPAKAAEPENSGKNDKSAKLKALNMQFKDRIIEFVNKDPCCDLRSVFIKYGKYLDEINSDSSVTEAPKPKPFTFSSQNTAENVAPGFAKFNNPQPATAETPKQTTFSFQPQAPKADEKASSEPTELQKNEPVQDTPKKQSSSESESDSEDEIKIQGPKFTLAGNAKPITSDKTFAFGEAKKQQKKEDSDSDSDSDIEIKGPQFTFSGTVKSDVFKLKKSDESETKEEPKEETKEEPKEEKKAMPKFSFGSNPNPFSSTTSTAATKESSSNDQTNETTSKPTFSFGNNQGATEKKDDDSATKPLKFSFSAPSKSENPQETEGGEKPSFTFGATKPNPFTASSSGFSFGKPTATPSTDEKPSFTFGTSKPSESTTDSKASFTFVAPATKENEKEKEDNASETKKPSLSFNFSNNTGAPTSAFSFGTAAPKTDDSTESSKPSGGFTFGQAKAPAFSFGKTNTETDNKTSSTTNPPSAGFKFSLPFNQTTNSSEEKKTTESTSTATTIEETNKTEEATDDSGSKQMSLQNGEEDEVPLFTQRSKLMTVNTETNGYDSRGVGELKLLQRKDDKSKIRLLCRSDGMGNILLNTALVKSFKYAPLTADNENLVKIPTIDESGKLVTYVARFKQKADGRLFVKSIEDAQNAMN